MVGAVPGVRVVEKASYWFESEGSGRRHGRGRWGSRGYDVRNSCSTCGRPAINVEKPAYRDDGRPMTSGWC